MSYMRSLMVQDLRKKGITSGALLDAVSLVPRHLFVSEGFRYRAYDDVPLPIGFGQTVSRPYVIALMIQSLVLRGHERVLEIGTGSGYQSAVLSHICSGVVTMERIDELSRRAGDAIGLLGLRNVQLISGGDFDAAKGKFDGIIVAAGAEEMPHGLFEKLNDNGTLVIPLFDGGAHSIRRYYKSQAGITMDVIGGAQFVPLILGESA